MPRRTDIRMIESGKSEYTHLGERIANEIATKENAKEEAENAKAYTFSDLGGPENAEPLSFTRGSTKTYKGRDYGTDEPIFDNHGIYLDSNDGESLKIPTAGVFFADEGTIEAEIVPTELVDYVNMFRMSYTNGRFLLYMDANGSIRFGLGATGEQIQSSEGLAEIGVPLKVIMKWSKKSRLYQFWVNDEYIGGKEYSDTEGNIIDVQDNLEACSSNSVIIRNFKIYPEARRV